MRNLGRSLVAMFVAGLTLSGTLARPALAQQGWPPDSTVNLQVLPEDISIPELIQTMKGFALALGVRCTHCHVGDDSSNLGTIDFPSDEKIEKRKAREMIHIRKRINDELLAALPERSDPPVEVRCETCHRGLPKPADIRDVLVAEVNRSGVEAAVAEYEALREQYYGSWTYDFREATLPDVAERLAVQQPDAALALLDHNLKHYPASAMTYVYKARILAGVKRDFDGAIAMVREAQRVQPDAPGLDRMLEQFEAAREAAVSPESP